MKLKVVVLQGFSGAGKTSVGRRLAERYGLCWVDVDAAIEKESGNTIKNIIRVEGEKRFRELETAMLKQLLAQTPGVISLGGGVLTVEENRKLLDDQSIVAVYLHVSPEVAIARIEQQEGSDDKVVRPLLSGSGGKAKRLELAWELFESRRQEYQLADLVVRTDNASIDQVTEVVFGEISAMGNNTKLSNSRSGRESNKKITATRIRPKVVIPSTSSAIEQESEEVVIGDGVVSELGQRIARIWPEARKVAVVIDQRVQERYGEKLLAGFQSDALTVSEIVIPSGERSKNLNLVAELSERMFRAGISREDVVIGCGGGVVGDITGLLASLYLRGVGLVHVPTTLVAQVDSAIGGKTGVNLLQQGEDARTSAGKNILGTFYSARLVLSDLQFLRDLPEREYVSGLAEVVKYGLIHSERFFSWLEKEKDKILERDMRCLMEIVEFCSQTKLDIVRKDFRDRKGERFFLNFGHTVGHALETLTSFSKYLHGEAVALGIVTALRIGAGLGVTDSSVVSKTESLLQTFGLPVEIPEELRGTGPEGSGQNEESWSKVLRADKKRGGDYVNFVLLAAVGRPVLRKVEISQLAKYAVS